MDIAVVMHVNGVKVVVFKSAQWSNLKALGHRQRQHIGGDHIKVESQRPPQGGQSMLLFWARESHVHLNFRSNVRHPDLSGNN